MWSLSIISTLSEARELDAAWISGVVTRHERTWKMLVSDKMPRGGVPSTQEPSRPDIPSRSSSILRTGGRTLQDRENKIFRHSMILDSERQPDFLFDDWTSASDQPDALRRRNSPIRTNGRSASCSEPSRKTMESAAKVQRWAGLTRSVCNWDGLRKVSVISSMESS
jgi:hypothetical protein